MADLLLAVRNLLRNRRRSVSTLVALAIGLASIMLFSGFQTNLGATMLTAVVRAGGHLQIQHRDYFLFGGSNPSAYGIAGYEDLVKAIRNDTVLGPMVSVATPMMRFGGLAGNFEAGISRTVIGTGYVAEDMSRMRQWNEYAIPVTRPKFPLEGTAPDSAIVGVGVARVLQLCAPLRIADCPVPEQAAPKAPPGKAKALPSDIADLAMAENASQAAPAGTGARLELLASSARGAPNVAALNVVAAEDQVFKELDEVAVLVHLGHAQRLVFGRAPPQATAVMVLLPRTADLEAATQRLQQIVDALPGGKALAVRSFVELNPFYAQSEQLFDFIFGFIFVLIGGIVLFTVSNTMNTAVVERTVEIGTLRAIGLRQSGIRRLFLLEGFMLGCAGAVTGILMAVLLGEIVNRSGLTWLPPGSSERLPLQLRVLGDVGTVAGTALGLVAIATASAWWPAWRAAQLKIVEALRHA
ncbi:ABC transporter permease [Pseudaquabacterium pictum]|uniref:Permease n=1 Tax=Pseudaquabacterium pictum TaxID=2315236 RepID=A0A480ASB4_9BURK|nr:FtsX-like permease family protein [Rubrivivax pictus]GCL64424.1 permease [Rubrivivax pictus]